MNTVVFAFSSRGKETALRVWQCLSEAGDAVEIRVPPRLAEGACHAYQGALPAFTGSVFDRDALIFVGACGIAVRAIAPHVADKRRDPAVLCVDERAGHVIPILSGHIGGANRLARRLAQALGAEAAITTATDVNGRFSVDEWAAERGLFIADMALAKRVSAEILERDIPICADVPLPPRLPEGLVPKDAGELGICVSTRLRRPFDSTLLLAPKALRVGIGCRRGAPEAAIEDAVRRVFEEYALCPMAVAGAASIDLKAEEPGLLAFCRSRGWPLRTYTAAQLQEVEGAVSSSEFVMRTVGVDNVCERAALAAGGRLIVPKQALGGVTVAVAEMDWGVEFG